MGGYSYSIKPAHKQGYRAKHAGLEENRKADGDADFQLFQPGFPGEWREALEERKFFEIGMTVNNEQSNEHQAIIRHRGGYTGSYAAKGRQTKFAKDEYIIEADINRQG